MWHRRLRAQVARSAAPRGYGSVEAASYPRAGARPARTRADRWRADLPEDPLAAAQASGMPLRRRCRSRPGAPVARSRAREHPSRGRDRSDRARRPGLVRTGDLHAGQHASSGVQPERAPARAAEQPGGAAPQCRRARRLAGELPPTPHVGQPDWARTVGTRWSGDALDAAEHGRMAAVGLDRCDDHAGFQLDEVNTDEGNLDPCRDHDALVEDTIQDFDRARGWRRPLRMHREHAQQAQCRQRRAPPRAAFDGAALR